ncbi:KR-domain-containing protein [Aspergillus aurantiobrunneus]
MRFAEAASLPTSLWVAYHAVYRVAQVQPGDIVLVLGAASRRGGRVLAATSTPVKRDFVRHGFCILSADVLIYDDMSIARKVNQVTDGQGVNVVIGSVSGTGYSDLSSCLAPCSRAIDISLAEGERSPMTTPKIAENSSYAPINLIDFLKKPLAGQQVFREAMALYVESNLKPPQPLSTFAAGDIKAAFDSFLTRDKNGKRVVEFTEGMPAQMDCVSKPLYSFLTDASYVIAGGLGGLGRCIAQWKVDRGARHLVLLSRTAPKVTGSWNLHQALPQDLDFFILLSSLNGIFGNQSQANYAAGNTFQDALTHSRLARGQRAVSIDLGLMVSEGVVAESEFLLASIRRIGLLMEIKQDEFLALLEHYCDPNLPLLTPDHAQVLVGTEIPSAVVARGIDLHHSMQRPIFSHLFRIAPHSSPAHHANTRAIHLPAALKAAALVLDWACSKMVKPDKPNHTYGIDSLVAIDLKNWFEREIGASVTLFDLMGNIPFREFCSVAAQTSRYRA